MQQVLTQEETHKAYFNRGCSSMATDGRAGLDTRRHADVLCGMMGAGAHPGQQDTLRKAAEPWEMMQSRSISPNRRPPSLARPSTGCLVRICIGIGRIGSGAVADLCHDILWSTRRAFLAFGAQA